MIVLTLVAWHCHCLHAPGPRLQCFCVVTVLAHLVQLQLRSMFALQKIVAASLASSLIVPPVQAVQALYSFAPAFFKLSTLLVLQVTNFCPRPVLWAPGY